MAFARFKGQRSRTSSSPGKKMQQPKEQSIRKKLGSILGIGASKTSPTPQKTIEDLDKHEHSTFFTDDVLRVCNFKNYISQLWDEHFSRSWIAVCLLSEDSEPWRSTWNWLPKEDWKRWFNSAHTFLSVFLLPLPLVFSFLPLPFHSFITHIPLSCPSSQYALNPLILLGYCALIQAPLI